MPEVPVTERLARGNSKAVVAGEDKYGTVYQKYDGRYDNEFVDSIQLAGVCRP